VLNAATAKLEKGMATLRILLGAGFLFAGLDKFFAWGGSAFNAAGFLKGATAGAIPGSDPKAVMNPTHDFWVSLGANTDLMPIVNFLVVFGEIAIGVALILGLATRFAGAMAVLMMALFYIANWSFANGPFNEQFFYGAIAAVLVYTGAGEYYGLDSMVEKFSFVKRHPSLKLVLE
jgi:thiosulfate dehydrogenase (quinone) large subunit